MKELAAPLMPAAVPMTTFLLTVLLSLIGDQIGDISQPTWERKYDYIVVGSGSAGAVIAARLSEDPKVSVLLLEAGGRENALTEVPGIAAQLQKTELDWSYKTVPQKNACLAMKEQRSPWPRGKALGGSTAINFMLYVRGNRRDYDRWAAEGCDGWSYADVLPYFLSMEDNCDPELLENGYHSAGGPLTVTPLGAQLPVAEAFVEAGKHLGYLSGHDYNGEIQSGFAYPQKTVRDGKRWSVTKAYLLPAAERPNLDIILSAHVSKILFKRQHHKSAIPEAHGVRFRRGNSDHEVFARKEVIISAGSINSPQLLMLSGIGPAQHLRKLNIPLVADLPVGENLHEQAFTNAPFTTAEGTSLDNPIDSSSVIDYLFDKEGPLITPGGIYGFGFVKTNFTDARDDWPDIQIHMSPYSPATLASNYKKTQDLTDEYVNKFLLPYANKNGFTLYPVLLRPKSRGAIRLNSSDFTDYPIIDFQYFDHPDDIDTLVQGLKICLAVGETPPMRAINAKIFQTVVPGCEKHELYSDAYLCCYVRHYVTGIWHPVGTCRMGSLDDPRTVVDTSLRVKGVRRLRVADSSIMPYVTSGNTNAPTIMIGERAADIIKGKLIV